VSRVYTIIRHGRRIEVEDLEPPKSARGPRRATREPFAKVYLDGAAAVAKALGSPIVLIAPLLIHLAWRTKSATFPLPNKVLTKYGVDRHAKYRVLRRLEKAGIIDVRNDPGKTTVVTLLVTPEDF
jgi:hypothetical protein